MPLRKVSRGHKDLIAILFKVADKLQLRNIEYTIQFGNEDIDMFISGIYKVRLKGSKDGQRIQYTVLVKWHEDPIKRQYLRELYAREYIFYQYIYPQLSDIQNRLDAVKGLKMNVVKHIFASNEYGNETIVLFHRQGFRLRDRFFTSDFAHASLVMKNLAKMHALSFVLEKTRPKEFGEIKKLLEKDVQYFDPDCISKCMQSCYNDSVNVLSDPKAKEKLKALAPKISLVLNKCTKAGPYSAICHGDCWNNNIFFKYQGGRPVDIMFTDYQLCRLASPVTDISYYMYMSTDRKFLLQHYDSLIQIYYGTLSAVLRYCDLDVEEIYPKNVLLDHLKRFSVLGLIEALVSMKIITAAAEEALQMTQMKYYTEDGLCENVTQNKDLYVERVNGVVDDFFDRDYSVDGLLSK